MNKAQPPPSDLVVIEKLDGIHGGGPLDWGRRQLQEITDGAKTLTWDGDRGGGGCYEGGGFGLLGGIDIHARTYHHARAILMAAIGCPIGAAIQGWHEGRPRKDAL
jgi:hypothetical protein